MNVFVFSNQIHKISVQFSGLYCPSKSSLSKIAQYEKSSLYIWMFSLFSKVLPFIYYIFGAILLLFLVIFEDDEYVDPIIVAAIFAIS